MRKATICLENENPLDDHVDAADAINSYLQFDPESGAQHIETKHTLLARLSPTISLPAKGLQPAGEKSAR